MTPKSDRHAPTEKARQSHVEDSDSHTAGGVLWISDGVRWEYLNDNVKQTNIGGRIDNAMDTFEKKNLVPRRVLPKNYGRQSRYLTPKCNDGCARFRIRRYISSF